MEPHLAWLAFVVGLGLGLIPPRFFYPEGCRHLTLVDVRGSSIHRSSTISSGRRRRSWWKLPLVWLDPLRGYISAHLLGLGLFFAIPCEGRFGTAILTLSHVACIAAILLVQITLGRQKPGQLLAPVFFLFGFTSGLYMDFTIVGAGVAALGVAAMLATHSFTWGYLAAGGGAAAIGFPFLGPSPALAIFAIVASAPVYLAFLRRATLVLPMRG